MAATLGDALISLGKLVVGGRAVVAGLEGLRDAIATRPVALADAATGPARITLHRVTTLRERVDHIRRMAHKGKVHPKIYEWTRQLLSQKCGRTAEGRTQWCVPEKDGDAEVIAIFNGVKDELRYTHDPLNVDGYAHPVRSLQWHGGDCDDAASVLAACLMSVGYEVKFLVIRTKDASDWNHILLAVKVPLREGGHKWCALDPTVQQPPGWYPPPELIADAREFDV